MSTGSGRRRRASAASARARASPASLGGSRDDLGQLGPRAVAVEHEVASGGDRPARPLAQAARQRLHAEIVGHQQPAKADLVADQRA